MDLSDTGEQRYEKVDGKWILKDEFKEEPKTKTIQKNGKRGCSCHKIIEDCGLLDKSYHQKAQELQHIYYPLEILPGLSKETRTKYMVDWVTHAHRLLIRSGLSKEKDTERSWKIPSLSIHFVFVLMK